MSLVGTEAIMKKFDLSRYAVLRMYKSGLIPGISIGTGRGSKIRFDLDMVERALQEQMLEEQEQRKVICAGQ